MTERRRRGPKRTRSVVADQPPYAQPRRRLPVTPLVTDDELDAIHRASLRVLAETGIDFLHPEARRLLAAAGARVDGDRVRFDPDMVLETVAHAPSEFILHGRRPERDLRIGGDWVTYASVASAPNYVDLDGVRRTGDRVGYQDFLRLGHMLNSVHTFAGYPVEPVDLHASIRHLEAAYDAHTLTDKSFHVYSLGRQRNLDGIEMARISRGVDHDAFEREPSITSIINASSPLRYDHPMLEGIIQMSARNQVIIITPFTLAGAMAPITLAGALVQQNAEALAGLAFTQVVRKGAPAMYGGFTSNVDMRSGAPAFGTPEYAKACLVGGQLARRYGVPYRSSAVSASNSVDAQAGYETVWALWGAIMGGANFVMHGAGWMEGGLHAGYDKMVVDADLLHMVSAFLEPLDTSDDALAVDAIAGVGPAGHFFGEAHTQARYQTEFYGPMVSDWRNWETWTDAGRPDARTRANTIARSILAEYEAPPIDDAIRSELRDFVDRRVSEGGVDTDF
ncbi:MAG: trimethylamine methyltransferase family protein [Ilumatobacter sp.]|uniref:trimethylamine methyltransferase family protein n=3 Tax=Ilumatobacter sp. TaxID=1967498 RepID=UPI0032985F5C